LEISVVVHLNGTFGADILYVSKEQAMFNRIILIGNLTKDVELRHTPGGTPIATIPVAVNSKYKQGDEMKEEVLFINCVVFGRQAESCGQYLSKGNPVLVEGRLRENKWEKDGVQKSRCEVIASTVRFLPKKQSDAQTSAAPSNSYDEVPQEVGDLEPF